MGDADEPPMPNAEAGDEDLTLTETEGEDFGDADQVRDFPFIVKGHQIFVNLGLVASLSPVLAQLAEGKSRAEGVQIRAHSFADMLELFRCICPHPTTKPVQESNVHLLLQLANEFQIEELRRRCEIFLHLKLESPDETAPGFNLKEHWLSILILASRYELEDLLRSVFPRLASQPLAAIDELVKSAAMPLNIAAAIYQAKTEKLATAIPRSSPHAFEEKRFRLRGASRRRCGQCQHVHPSTITDRCKHCRRVLCPKCQGYKYCEFNVHRHCAICYAASTSSPKKLGPPYKEDEVDPCHCGYTNPPMHFLRTSSATPPNPQ